MSAPVAPRIAYVNGRYLPLAEATLPIMDRGFLFGDGIYEVTAVLGDHFVDNEPHLARLDRSLRAIGIRNPHTIPEWTAIQRELVRQNDLKQGTVYIEVTRGTYEREFTCPDDIAPNVVMFTQAKNLLANPMAETGAAVITVDDLRWARRDIKSVALLAQVLAKFEAKHAGVAEAVMLEDGVVTEGASSTFFILSSVGVLVTRALSNSVLPGVTRSSVMRLARETGLPVEERPFTRQEMLAAREVFYTSASSFVMPVVAVDGEKISGGRPGPITKKLRAIYLEEAQKG
ncbi:MAG: D-amino-acid transaminase [Methylobacterium sp.]|nr:D-amino-acid transaminase [Methylobacterium sp.]MCA3653823.1 D-amino-acid transaminase [Methylobacterium sp.]MCA3657082.1 D-amino-acid transaminase [Methylobacterium sp.]MCA3662183.1 D-amino-acid transaminase [Methylobacterium sp.]MCA3664226.1 D-amino-acid transaminase [Methylobacterium sp.]